MKAVVKFHQNCVSFLRRKQISLLVGNMPGVGLMVRVVGLGSEDPEFKSRWAIELIPGGVDCLSSFRGRQNEYQLAGILCQSGDPSRIVANSQGDYLSSTRLCTEYGPNGWTPLPP